MRKVNRNWIFLLGYGIWAGAVVWLLGGCQSSRISVDAEQRQPIESALSGGFTFQADVANPSASQAYLQASSLALTQNGNSATRINLRGDGYFLTLQENHVRSRLPYFGDRTNVTDYNRPGGIEVDDEVSEYSSKAMPDGQQIEFFANAGYERFRFILKVRPGLRASLSVFSPQRSVIRYTGAVLPDAEVRNQTTP